MSLLGKKYCSICGTEPVHGGNTICRNCAKLAGVKQPRFKPLLLTLSVLIGGSLLAVCGMYAILNLAGYSSRAYRVEYAVTGEGTNKADITYSLPGSTAQNGDASLPWTYSFKAQRGEFLYLSAQNQYDGGSIVAGIYVDGKKIRRVESTGPHVVATASCRIR